VTDNIINFPVSFRFDETVDVDANPLIEALANLNIAEEKITDLACECDDAEDKIADLVRERDDALDELEVLRQSLEAHDTLVDALFRFIREIDGGHWAAHWPVCVRLAFDAVCQLLDDCHQS
jgi:hypothetical protein